MGALFPSQESGTRRTRVVRPTRRAGEGPSATRGRPGPGGRRQADARRRGNGGGRGAGRGAVPRRGKPPRRGQPRGAPPPPVCGRAPAGRHQPLPAAPDRGPPGGCRPGRRRRGLRIPADVSGGERGRGPGPRDRRGGRGSAEQPPLRDGCLLHAPCGGGRGDRIRDDDGDAHARASRRSPGLRGKQSRFLGGAEEAAPPAPRPRHGPRRGGAGQDPPGGRGGPVDPSGVGLRHLRPAHPGPPGSPPVPDAGAGRQPQGLRARGDHGRPGRGADRVPLRTALRQPRGEAGRGGTPGPRPRPRPLRREGAVLRHGGSLFRSTWRGTSGRSQRSWEWRSRRRWTGEVVGPSGVGGAARSMRPGRAQGGISGEGCGAGGGGPGPRAGRRPSS